MTKLVFVYGSLKRGYWNNRLLATSRFLAEAITVEDNFVMYDGAFPYVATGGISKVKGELFEVDNEETLRNLDRLEGVPTHYIRKETKFYVLPNDGEPAIPGLEHIVEGFMYVAAPSTAARLKDSRKEYVIEPNDEHICEWGDD
jgi:gamma-glutamylcyclotransferase (GGCT)/AIG2-like uncharacterized protein YtfP